MSDYLQIDDGVIARLPLPLARATHGVSEARNPLDRSLCAFFVWESGLKLLASVAIIELAEMKAGAKADLLKDLARPSLGTWWAFARRLTLFLADAGDDGFCRVRDLLFSSPRASMPRAAGLFTAIEEYLGRPAAARSTVSIAELFDRLVMYRNMELGHGATGRRPDAFYDKMARALLTGILEVFAQLDVLAGRRLLYVGEVRRHSSGDWWADRYELAGDRPKRIETLTIPNAQSSLVPRPQRVYIERKAGAKTSGLPAMHSLHPLNLFDLESKEYFFFNARRGKQQIEYLCLTSGRHLTETFAADSRPLLAAALELPLSAAGNEPVQTSGDDEEPASASPRTTFPPDESARGAGQTIGEYELISELGRGGMGIVYRAWQPSLGRQVALKRMFKLGDPVADRRFAREIHALARVEHPNVVKALTSGSHGDQWFLVMEMVEGADLTTVCGQLNKTSAADIDHEHWNHALTTACDYSRSFEKLLTKTPGGTKPQAPLPANPSRNRPVLHSPDASPRLKSGKVYIRKIVELMQKVADATHAVNEAGIVHRDIKPGNIRITPAGEPVLMDLGVAQLVDESEGRLTKTRQNVGTLRYMSPEQMLAVGKVDRRADVYSLGATLWELLTLQPLFEATDKVPDAEVMRRIQTVEPQSLRRFNRAVPKDLEATVLKCLEKNNARRYATAADLAADLSRFLHGEPVLAQPASLTYLAGKFMRRHRWPLATALAVMILLLSAAVVSFIRINQERTAALQANRRLEEEAYVKNIAVAERELTLNQDHDLALDLLQSCPERLRGWEWNYLVRLRDGARKPLIGHKRALWMADFSPDGKNVATCSVDGTVKIWDSASGALINTIDAQPTPVVAGGLADSIASVMAPSGLPNIPIMCLAYSPDGQYLATGSVAPKVDLVFPNGLDDPKPKIDIPNSPGAVTLWNAHTLQQVGEFRDQHGLVISLAFSPDGLHVASSTINPEFTFAVWDAQSRELIKTVGGHKGVVSKLRYSPNGRILAAADVSGAVKLWDAESLVEIRSIDAHPAPVMDIAFSPGGERFATAGQDGSIRVWETDTGRKIRTQKGHNGSALGVAFSPDGKRIASAGFDRTVRIWNADTGQETLTLRGHTELVWTVAFSRDGRRLVSSSFDETARIWDATPVTELPAGVIARLTGHDDRVNAVAYSKDGRYLATSSWDRDVRIWDAQTNECLHTLKGHQGAVWGIAFSPDGSRIASASWDQTVKIWDTASGQVLQTLSGHTAPVHAVAYSGDGKMLASAGWDGQIKIWDAGSGKMLNHCDNFVFPVYTVAFSPDGKLLASGGTDRHVKLWDVKTGKPDRILGEHQGSVSNLAFTKDGKLLVTAGWDNRVKIWRIRGNASTSGDPNILTLAGHTGMVNGISISPDGSTIASASEDKTVRFWDIRTGKEKCPPLHHTGNLWSVAFHPDGKRVATACWSKSGWIWTWDISKVLRPSDGN